MRLVFRLGSEAHPVDLSPGPNGSWRVVAGGRTLAARLAQPDAGQSAAGAGAAGNPRVQSLVVELDGRPRRAVVARDGSSWWVALGGVVALLEELAEGDEPPARAGHGPLEVVSPIPGRVLRVLVAEGDRVEAGQVVASIEAMKMENGLRAERAGRVARVLVRAGDRVEPGQLLVELAAGDQG